MRGKKPDPAPRLLKGAALVDVTARLARRGIDLRALPGGHAFMVVRAGGLMREMADADQVRQLVAEQ
jgi:hypothetical protein